jgi:hypothetical protein
VLICTAPMAPKSLSCIRAARGHLSGCSSTDKGECVTNKLRELSVGFYRGNGMLFRDPGRGLCYLAQVGMLHISTGQLPAGLDETTASLV